MNQVEHQKLNQTTVSRGTVLLSFWCSTQPSTDTGTNYNLLHDCYHKYLRDKIELIFFLLRMR